MLSEIILTVAGAGAGGVYGGKNKGNPSESDK